MFRKKPPADNGNGRPDERELSVLQKENRNLRRAVDELTVLNEIARAISATDSYQEVIDQLVNHSLRSVHAEQVVISLVDRLTDNDPKTVVRTLDSSNHPEFHLTQGLLGLMLVKKEPLLSNDPASDSRLSGMPRCQDQRSLLCVPLIADGEITGILGACNSKGPGGFTPEDQRLLAIIASQSAQVLENARLREEEVKLEAMTREVGLARDIQIGLLPEAPPEVPGYDLAAVSVPAKSVGGDYYDFIPLDGDRLAICLGDVSGKGIPASLLMANLQATMRGQAHSNPHADSCLVWANRLLYRSTPPEKFATLFFGFLDARNHELNYSNAGHERPLLWSNGGQDTEPIPLGEGGVMLGALEEFPYVGGTVSLGPGNLLVLYSDGVTDAEDSAGQPFGDGRLLDLIRSVVDRPAAEVMQTITSAVQAHAAGVPQLDDITLVVVRRKK